MRLKLVPNMIWGIREDSTADLITEAVWAIRLHGKGKGLTRRSRMLGYRAFRLDGR